MQPSISAFFPCYNDAATIGGVVEAADRTLRRLTDDYEIIVVNDGSRDNSADVLAALAVANQRLRVVTHEKNRGYGGALRTGFAEAKKDLVFYTDGDAQYDPGELQTLYAELAPDVDVVQAWKIERHDGWHRKVLGRMYHHVVRFGFGLHVRDIDCDFRLIRRRVLDSFSLKCASGSICVELLSRIEQGGFRVREVGVHHYSRPYGHSQFFSFGRIAGTLWQLLGLWFSLRFSSDVRAPEYQALPPVPSVSSAVQAD
ncbi:MAG TPA: glycosyltransferase family 2 protein [Chloroflexota bacterium]|nr:glycosyltransferase family 2 protein [Chloroflexota bacterium]